MSFFCVVSTRKLVDLRHLVEQLDIVGPVPWLIESELLPESALLNIRKQEDPPAQERSAIAGVRRSRGHQLYHVIMVVKGDRHLLKIVGRLQFIGSLHGGIDCATVSGARVEHD